MRVIFRIFHEATGSIIELLRANRRVGNKIELLKKCETGTTQDSDERIQLPVYLLMSQLEEELSRRSVIEEKAKTNVLGITLAFSAMFAGVALISSSCVVCDIGVRWFVWPFLSTLFIGAIFLSAGGVLALSALRIEQVYSWSLEDEAKSTSDKAKVETVLRYLDLNQLSALLKSNKVDASYICIRNGVVALVTTAMLVALFMIQQ